VRRFRRGGYRNIRLETCTNCKGAGLVPTHEQSKLKESEPCEI
jgi:hypothetical protein